MFQYLLNFICSAGGPWFASTLPTTNSSINSLLKD